jgi:Ala-tRNA(Pro) deacylase
MPADRLKSYLEIATSNFVTLTHEPAYTAQEIAASAHVPGRELAKTVIVKIDGQLAMVVVPATTRIEPQRLKAALGARDVAIASEDDFADAFPDCETGAMPPFGNLYGMPVFVSQSLREDELICFSAGSHTELVRLPYTDFESLVGPTPITT